MVDGWKDRQMDGWKDGSMNECLIFRWIDEWMDGYLISRLIDDAWMDNSRLAEYKIWRTDAWSEGRKCGRKYGRKGRRIYVRMNALWTSLLILSFLRAWTADCFQRLQYQLLLHAIGKGLGVWAYNTRSDMNKWNDSFSNLRTQRWEWSKQRK
jgi:hypothetical protein